MAVVDTYTAPAQTSFTAKHFYAVGANGDSDPGIQLEAGVLHNLGTVNLRYGTSLTEILAGVYATIADDTALPVEGPRDNLIMYNPEAATAGSFTFTAVGNKRNSGKDAGGLAARSAPATATRYTVIRPSKVAGAVTDTTVRVTYQRTITAIKLYSVTVPSGGTITLDVLDSSGRTLCTQKDLETVVTLTLTTLTLSTTTPLLLKAGEHITVRYSSSAGGDTLGDTLVEIAHTVT